MCPSPKCYVILAFQRKRIFKHQQVWTVAINNRRIVNGTSVLPAFINKRVNTNDSDSS